MPLCFPEKSTSGPDDIAGMPAPPGLIGVEGMNGVDALSGIIPCTERKISIHYSQHFISKKINKIKIYIRIAESLAAKATQGRQTENFF